MSMCSRVVLSLYVFLVLCCSPLIDAFLQADEAPYLNNFNQIIAKSYAQPLPRALVASTCKTNVGYDAKQVMLPSGNVNAAMAQSICGTTSICVVSRTTTLTMDGSLVVGALLNFGIVTWTSTTQTSPVQWLCAGYVVTDGGSFTLNVEDWTKQAIIYIKNNGALHDSLRTRVFGGLNGARITVSGTPMSRTWSLLSRPVAQGANTITLMHDVNAMGWHVGDRIVIAPTTFESSGTSDVFTIGSISGNLITLASAFPTNSLRTTQSFTSSQSVIETAWIAQQSAEVMDMTRNVLITGDDFVHRGCVAPMATPTTQGIHPTQDCSCINGQLGSYFRKTCTLGLHTIIAGKGSTLVMTNTRVEKCGQRGILGKYCIHLHEVGSCPTCVIRGNSVEYGHHRGITIHGSHSSLVTENVISDVRGANIYVEDGNEMHNQIRYNVAVCPWPVRDATMHGCTIPGTDEDQADTSLNQAGIWGVSFTNDVIGNRFANHFNGMLYQAQGFEHGRDDTMNRECTVNQQIGRLEGNTFHGHGRFGTYFLSSIFPKQLDRTVANDGLVPPPIMDAGNNPVWPSCAAYTADGTDRGAMYALVRNVDYGCGFVGQYNLGDIQYREHTSIGNEQAFYWKEVKNPADGCTPMVINSYFYGIPYVSWANMGLPGGHGTIVLDTVTLGGWITFESNHHCGVGVTGVLCMPTYVFVKPNTNGIVSFQYIWGANNGAMWNLSPDDGMNPTGQMFPAGYISLANPYWTYLLSIDNGTSCISSSSPQFIVPMMSTYGGGLLCKRPLRRLEVYTPNLKSSMNPPRLRLELWQNRVMISYVIVPFWQIDQGQTGKNGYGMTVIPGLDHSYRLMREDMGPIPSDWVIEFSDPIFGNRWARDEIYLTVVGRTCPSIVHSLHDRTMTWYDSENHPFTPGHGACTNQPDMPPVNCRAIAPPPNGMSCPGLCPAGCNNGYCDCGTGKCQCESGFSGPNCASDVCAASGCDPVGGRCATRYLGGTLQPVEGSCVCRDGYFGSKCDINPCKGQTCSGHGKCHSTSQTTTFCNCDSGWGGSDCSISCPGSVSGYRMYANNNMQMNIYSRAPATTATECREQCTSDGGDCVAASFYNSNYCARMSSFDTTNMVPTTTSTLLQANAASTVLFIKCGVSVPTTAVTVAPTTVVTTTPQPTTTSQPTLSPIPSSGPGSCVNGFITYQDSTYDLMGLTYTSTTTASACLALCAAMDSTSCTAAVWYNKNACVRYTSSQAQGKTITPSPDPNLPRTLFVRCTPVVTQPPTQVPTTQSPATQAPGTQAPVTQTPATTSPTSSTSGSCVNGFQRYPDTTWDLMGLPNIQSYTAQACESACAAAGPACAAAVWYNMNACVLYTPTQTTGQVMKRSPDPTLPRTLIVRCTATTAPTSAPTTAPTQAPATRAPVTQSPATQAPATQTPATTSPTSSSSGSCVNGFQRYPDTTWDLMGLPNIQSYTALACESACAAAGPACAAAVWYNMNACVLYTQAQTVGQVMKRSPDPTLPRTLIVRCTPTTAPTSAPTTAPTQPPATRAPVTQSPATQAPATQTPATTSPTSSSSGSCINGFQRYPDTTWDLMGLPNIQSYTALACESACAAAGPACAAAVWYNMNACVLYTQAQTIGQVMKRSPDPTLPRTLIVRCTATTQAPTQAPSTPTTAPTQSPATTAPSQSPATQSPTTSPTTAPGQPLCLSGFQTYPDSTFDLLGLPFTSTSTASACMALCSTKDARTCAGAVWYNFNACVLFNSQQIIGNTVVKSPDPKLPRTTFVRCTGAAGTITSTPTITTTCSSVVCSIPTCGNGTPVLGLPANPAQGLCCDLYSCQSRMAASIPAVASSQDMGLETNIIHGTSQEITSTQSSSSSSHGDIIGISVGMGVLLMAIGVMLWYRRSKQSSVGHITSRIRVQVDDDGHDDADKESGDVVTAMIPFTASPVSPHASPSPASSMVGISPVLRGMSPPLTIPQLTPLSSISLDSPSPHTGTMSHRHPLRPSTSATSLLDPRTKQPRISQQEGEEEQHQP